MNCILIRPLWIWLKKLIKALLVLFGIISLLMFLLSLTSIPFWAHYNLGIYGEEDTI
jgi:drug/metabolite transporter superfamily protein YnfA